MEDTFELKKLRQQFLDYFEHLGYQKHVASSLVPVNDPSVLFTTAGMQQFKDYYANPDLAPNKKLTTSQPVIRTTDIAEVGDDTHLTMFEMLGIFSFGVDNLSVLKKDAIMSMWQFVNKRLAVDSSRFYATVFEGDKLIPKDDDAIRVWQDLNVKTELRGRGENFWELAGTAGPSGPTSELFIDGVEVGNLVFNQFSKNILNPQDGKYYTQDGQAKSDEYTSLPYFGLDFGSGLERLAATLQNKSSVWQIEPFVSLVNLLDTDNEKAARIIVDHLRAAVFLISAGVLPANKGRDYILRRLIRKVVFLSSDIANFSLTEIVEMVVGYYEKDYDLKSVKDITDIINKEKEQFEKNLVRAKSYLSKWLIDHKDKDEQSVTELAFYMYESFGFPKELVIEHLASLGHSIDIKHFDALFVTHQEVSRQGLENQFKGGLADHGEQTIKHHTAHHLLLAALQQVLGAGVVQRGSNVTSERLRLDFNFDRKLTPEELTEVGRIVNDKIKEDLSVIRTEMPKEQALKTGAQAEFGQKYGDVVTVYSINNRDGSVFSKELCGGPHVTHTGELGHFEILKEEASSQGIRRIKARVV